METTFQICEKNFNFGLDIKEGKIVENPRVIGGFNIFKNIRTITENDFNVLFYGNKIVNELIKRKIAIKEEIERQRSHITRNNYFKKVFTERNYDQENLEINLAIELKLANDDLIEALLILHGKIIYSKLILQIEELQDDKKKDFSDKKSEFETGIWFLQDSWKNMTSSKDKTIESIKLWRETLKDIQD